MLLEVRVRNVSVSRLQRRPYAFGFVAISGSQQWFLLLSRNDSLEVTKVDGAQLWNTAALKRI